MPVSVLCAGTQTGSTLWAARIAASDMCVTSFVRLVWLCGFTVWSDSAAAVAAVTSDSRRERDSAMRATPP